MAGRSPSGSGSTARPSSGISNSAARRFQKRPMRRFPRPLLPGQWPVMGFITRRPGPAAGAATPSLACLLEDQAKRLTAKRIGQSLLVGLPRAKGAKLREDFDSPLLEPEVNSIDSPGVVEAQKPVIVRGKRVHRSNLPHRIPGHDRPEQRNSPTNHQSSSDHLVYRSLHPRDFFQITKHSPLIRDS